MHNHRELGKNPRIELRINVTTECKLNCPHCFMKLRKYDVSTMSDDTIDRMVSLFQGFVEQHGENHHSSVQVIGGEPLLYPNKTFALIEGLRLVAPATKLKTSTNGNLLTCELIKQGIKSNMEWQLSANANSIEYIENRMQMITQNGGKVYFSIVLSEQNLNRLNRLLEMAYKYTSEIKMTHQWGNVGKDYLALYERVIPQTLKWMLDSGTIFNPEILLDRISFLYTDCERYYRTCVRCCHYRVDPDGAYGVCVLSGNNLGNIWDEHFNWERVLSLQQPKWHELGIPECERCELRPYCGGGCVAQRVQYYKRDDVPTPFCTTYKQAIPMMLEMRDIYDENSIHSREMGLPA